MKIQPNDNWRWYFDEQYNRVMLDLSNEMVFRSRFMKKMLTADAFKEHIFSVEDASLYYSFLEQCQSLPLQLEEQTELALNAVVAFRFVKPQMPKSWYFLPVEHPISPSSGDIVIVNVDTTKEQANMLVVEVGQQASLCLLAQKQLEIGGRMMLLGDAIKIMHDRLSTYLIVQGKKSKYARAV